MTEPATSTEADRASKCLEPDGCPDPETGMPCNECWAATKPTKEGSCP